jgi:hypothetical protein
MSRMPGWNQWDLRSSQGGYGVGGTEQSEQNKPPFPVHPEEGDAGHGAPRPIGGSDSRTERNPGTQPD